MSRALELARSQLDDPRGRPFGAVVVRGGEVLGEGHNEALFTHDPTAHAEVVAIRRACQATGSFRIDGATLYSSCAPCPMCLAAIHWAGVRKLYFACTTETMAQFGFGDKDLYEKIGHQMKGGVVEATLVMEADGVSPFKIWAERWGGQASVSNFR